jgi:serine/threonine protein kinase
LYNAPEKKTGSYDGKITDLFSAGVILFNFVTNRPPFTNATQND